VRPEARKQPPRPSDRKEEEHKNVDGGEDQGHKVVGEGEWEKTDSNHKRDQFQDQPRRWGGRFATEDDIMKFSHSIQFNGVPDWSDHYVAYSNLKKL
jgi:hypothetical protein